MKRKYPIWLLSVAVACMLGPGVIAASAQPTPAAEDNPDTNVIIEANPEAMQNAEAPKVEDEGEEKPTGIRREAVMAFGKDVELKAEDTAEAVIVFGGNAKVHGRAREGVVVFGGNIELDGQAREVVAIGGNITVRGRARDTLVAILGSVNLEPGAKVDRDIVAIGGKVNIADGVSVGGRVQEIDLGVHGLPNLEGLKRWIVQCVLKMRPLALQVPWVWAVWGVFLLIYLLIAVAFPRPVQNCVSQLIARPASSFLVGLLAKIFLPVIFLVLVMTGIGILVVPFLVAIQVIGVIVGKVAILEYFGGKIGRATGLEALQRPIAGFLLGAIILTLLYLVPFVGLIALSVTSLWGFGAAVAAMFAGMKREAPRPPAPTAPPPADSMSAAAVPVTAGAAAENIPAATATATPAGAGTAIPPATVAFPRAGFWERMGAAFLDLILVCILGAIAGGPPLLFLVGLAYFAGMWAWKGTTVGGIVLKLQVVRYDGGQLTFLVALVRALAAAFSAVVLFLGFFWIAWDPERQAWHDKIAGTVVVRAPSSIPLVCL